MGAANLSDARVLSALVLLATAAPAPAQAPLSREFERAFFARREAWLDRLFTAAPAELRRKALPLVQAAVAMRGHATSLSGERMRSLARACAVLSGLEADDAAFEDRFNFFLLALPEVVDPFKVEGDRARHSEVTAPAFPLLKPIVVEDPSAPCKDRDTIFLTARGTFSFRKPPGLLLRLRVGDAVVERGDVEDPAGWSQFALSAGFPLTKHEPGTLLGRVEVGVGGTWPRPVDPPVEAPFALHPGFYRDVWALLVKRSVVRANIRIAKPARELERLEIYVAEVMRVLLGKEWVLRAWPLQALREGSELASAILAEKLPELPAAGDRVYGVPVDDGRLVPLRVQWRPGQKRAFLVLPPSEHDESWLADGLGLGAEAMLGEAGGVVACTTYPLAPGYLPGALALLREVFGIEAKDVTLVGALDGATRARYAKGLLSEPVREIVLVGPDLAAETGQRVVAAYTTREPRSLREALTKL